MSLLRTTYYALKPFLPDSVRLLLRRAWASRQHRVHGALWPINPAAGVAPENWPGWPDGKRFAFVLTHDVEGQRGVDRCRMLARIDQAAGFHSSFNFVPEGGYDTPSELRIWLQNNGFEVGVHDLRHDGKLYWSRRAFRSYSQAINRYMKEWGAVGFRSGFMLRNLEWLSEIHMLYDSSTFDTDPFEPQPDGAQTIFPFWVPAPDGSQRPASGGPTGSAGSALSTRHSPRNNGYIELPYTLPQDSTLFVVLREQTNRIWKQKLDWIVSRGGMALMNTHPDYMKFESCGDSPRGYPASIYQDFLDYVRSRYRGQYWTALPREVADYTRSLASNAQEMALSAGNIE